ncbi:MAG: 50S ribosomal protein L29 [Candidatus Andersenbacteria bacterium]
MKTHDLRNLPVGELTGNIEKMQHDYFSLQESTRTGKEKNHARLRQLRQDIARAKTILREKRLDA